MPAGNGFNESHRRRLLANAQYADKLISDIEEILGAADSQSPFPKYRPDVSLHQGRVIRSQLARFRDHLGRVLAAVGVAQDGAQFGALHAIRATLPFVRIAVQEMGPEHLRGYGELPDAAATELRGLCAELEGLLDNLERSAASGAAADLQTRLERLGRTAREADLLHLLDRIISEDGLAEFRAPLVTLVEKLESPRFEVAVFGRVSSGKSSLLNHLLETDVLPVGVNPITAVPTRLVFGEEAHVTVTLAGGAVRQRPLSDLAEFASEERNPGNELGVTKLVVTLPSPRLENGLVLVDTPGLGALAAAGAAETRSYLPQCDWGILLLSAVNPIDNEDLHTFQSLALAGIPVMGLLSKADLLSPADRRKALEYTKREVLANLGLRIEVHPVSTVGDGEEMLHEWFRGQLAPLLGRHRELARESIRRKAGVLREAVLGALRVKLGHVGEGTRVAASLEEIERGLRTAAGEIETARRFCLNATDDVRVLHKVALGRCVEEVLASWDGPRSEAPAGAGVTGRTAEKLAADASSQIAGCLGELADHLQAALSLAAEALGDGPPSDGGSLRECVREMPRFEAAVPEVRIERPWFRALHGVTRAWVARRLQGDVSAGLQAGFTNYGRAMEAWVRRVLADLQQRFDARADAYRAQLARLMAHHALPAEQRGRLEDHVAELEGMAPSDAAVQAKAQPLQQA